MAFMSVTRRITELEEDRAGQESADDDRKHLLEAGLAAVGLKAKAVHGAPEGDKGEPALTVSFEMDDPNLDQFAALVRLATVWVASGRITGVSLGAHPSPDPRIVGVNFRSPSLGGFVVDTNVPSEIAKAYDLAIRGTTDGL